MSEASVTIAGRLTADPVLRVTHNTGLSVVNFTVAHTPRRKNAETGEYEDAGETLFLRVTAWGVLAERVRSSLHKGDAVVVSGALTVSTYTNELGISRTDVNCNADTVAADLRWQTAAIIRPERTPESVPESWAPAASSAAAA